MEKSAILTVKTLDPDEKAILAAQKSVLKEIYLVDSKIWRDPLVVSPDVLALEHKFTSELLDQPGKDNEARPINDFILCKFRVAAFNDELPNKPVMKIEATFLTSFTLDLDDPDVKNYYYGGDFDVEDLVPLSFGDHLIYLCTVIPITNAWPYWREFVQSMSARMGFPALTVPLLEIVYKKASLDKVKDHLAKKKTIRRKKVNA